jgi:hypothetical protein
LLEHLNHQAKRKQRQQPLQRHQFLRGSLKRPQTAGVI